MARCASRARGSCSHHAHSHEAERRNECWCSSFLFIQLGVQEWVLLPFQVGGSFLPSTTLLKMCSRAVQSYVSNVILNSGRLTMKINYHRLKLRRDRVRMWRVVCSGCPVNGRRRLQHGEPHFPDIYHTEYHYLQRTVIICPHLY